MLLHPFPVLYLLNFTLLKFSQTSRWLRDRWPILHLTLFNFPELSRFLLQLMFSPYLPLQRPWIQVSGWFRVVGRQSDGFESTLLQVLRHLTKCVLLSLLVLFQTQRFTLLIEHQVNLASRWTQLSRVCVDAWTEDAVGIKQASWGVGGFVEVVAVGRQLARSG